MVILKQLLPLFSSPSPQLNSLYGAVNLLFNFIQHEDWDLTYYFISNAQNVDCMEHRKIYQVSHQ